MDDWMIGGFGDVDVGCLICLLRLLADGAWNLEIK
jgi:hypothetical protein